jgi:hypothetical protein
MTSENPMFFLDDFHATVISLPCLPESMTWYVNVGDLKILEISKGHWNPKSFEPSEFSASFPAVGSTSNIQCLLTVF